MIKILVAEDNAVNQIVACKLLRGLGVQVDVAENGFQAVTMVGQKTYDLVFMDCQMPEMDGYQATAEIRHLQHIGRIHTFPIVALTAHSMPTDRQKCLDAGMDDYITKPVAERNFVDALKKWVGNFAEANSQMFAQEEKYKYISLPQIKKMQELMGAKFLQLLDIYKKTVADLLQQLSSGLKERKIEKVLHAAHTIKSPSKQIGSNLVADIAGEIEDLMREAHKNPENTQKLLDMADIKFSILRELIPSAENEITQFLAESTKLAS